MSNMRRGLWQQSDFIKVLAGETVSDIGSRIGGLALPLAAALVLQATPAQMAALRITEFLPRVLVGLVAGVWIDRVRRRPALIATNAARAALVMLAAAAAALGVLSIEYLYAAGLALAALGIVFNIAMAAYLPTLVPPGLLVQANGARATSDAAAEVAGQTLAGVLLQILGVPLALAMDGASFVASAGGIALVRAPEPPPPPRAERRRLDAELRTGLRTLVGHRILSAFLATAFTAQFFYSVIQAIYVLYLTRDRGLSPTVIGVVFGLGGGGGVLLGSAVASWCSRRFGLGRTLVVAHLLFGVLGILLALTLVWPSAAASLVFAAEFTQLAANAVYMVNRVSVEQAVTPPNLRGRVQSGQVVAHALSGVLGLAFGGVLGEAIGVGAAIVAGTIGGLLSFVWLWWSPVRDLATLPSPAVVGAVSEAQM